MAQNYKEKCFQRSPHISFVVGPQDIHKIPEIVGKFLKERKPGTVPCGDSPWHSPLLERKIWETDSQERPEHIYRSGFFADKKHAYVVISEGCSNFCSYCVVPYVRGSLRHRPSRQIIAEIKEALEKGIRQITLLGQNVNAYRDNGVDFAGLLQQVNSLDGIEKFGFVTSHPKDVSVDFFKLISSLDKLEKYLHLPVQSGSDRILKLMNRGYSVKYYLDLAHSYRKIIKDAKISTDIIVGFPTETEEDFKGTCDLLKEVSFNSSYIFKYSPRPHTAAAKLEDDITKEEKEMRHAKILELQRRLSKKLKMKSGQ